VCVPVCVCMSPFLICACSCVCVWHVHVRAIACLQQDRLVQRSYFMWHSMWHSATVALLAASMHRNGRVVWHGCDVIDMMCCAFFALRLLISLIFIIYVSSVSLVYYLYEPKSMQRP